MSNFFTKGKKTSFGAPNGKTIAQGVEDWGNLFKHMKKIIHFWEFRKKQGGKI